MRLRSQSGHAVNQTTQQRQGQDGRRAPQGGSAQPGARSRLAAAFEAVERFPVLVESRARVMRAATAETARVGELVEAVESDVALTIAVLRFANRSGGAAGGVASIPEAVEVLKPSGVLAIAGTAPVFDFFEPNGGWELRPERFRVHALATQRAADQIGRAVGWADRDELAVAALLHDVGRLVISRLHPGYQRLLRRRRPHPRAAAARRTRAARHRPRPGRRRARPALERAAADRGRDRAPSRRGRRRPGGDGRDRRHGRPLLAGRGGLAGAAARRRRALRPRPRRRCASSSTSFPTRARTAPRISEPCPLSARELDVLRHLSEGMVYKQIAGEMQLSVSTIRTHLHNVYGKIGAVDRAQAVLTARDRGWI